MNESVSQSDLTFHAAAIRSGLVTERKYEKVCELVGTREPDVISATLVKSGIITQYQADQLSAGRTKLNLGPYLITDWIGQGGMGQVFKAVHRVMRRVCAVKVLPLEKSTLQSRESFIREIQLQAELDHPNVVRAFDAGQDGSVHYLVTEYVPGTDLRQLVKNNGALSQSNAASIVIQAALGLEHAHQIGLVHRDIKPGNVLVTPDSIAKLSDIGLATWSMGIDDDPRAGKIVGTADYLSPEQIQNPRGVGKQSDLYSLGCTMYYMVTGKVPFPGGDSRSKCRRHCETTPWHPRKFAPELSEDFVDIIADMMEKDPGDRIGSAAEVATRLEPFAEDWQDNVSEPLQRQSWLPPPPPHERPTSDFASSGEGRSDTSTASRDGSRDTQIHRSDSGSASAVLPPPLNLESEPPQYPATKTWRVVLSTVLWTFPIAATAGYVFRHFFAPNW